MMTDGFRIVEKWIDILNRKAVHEVGEVFHDTGRVHYPGLADAQGPTEIGNLLQPFFTAFPDLHSSIEDIFSSTDGRVVGRFLTSGTHSAPFMGMEATGKTISIEGIAVFQLKDGKVVEEWNLDDIHTLARQIGLLPG